MFADCLQIMRVHSQLIRVEGVKYSQIIRAEKADVCRSCGLYLQVVTPIQSAKLLKATKAISFSAELNTPEDIGLYDTVLSSKDYQESFENMTLQS